MTLVYGLIWGTWVIFAIVVVWAFAWALRSGQFDSLSAGAQTLFDEEEPIGEMTDSFPGTAPEDIDGPERKEDGHV